MPRKPRTHEEIKEFMDSLGDVPSALVSAETPNNSVWGIIKSPGENSPFAETAKRIENMTPEEKAVFNKRVAENIRLDNEKKKIEKFKADPKNWVGVCNFCQGDVIAKIETRYSETPRIGGPSNAYSVVNYYYCKGCSILYHTCVNKKEM